MESREVDPGLGNQCRQTGNEIHRLEGHLCRSVEAVDFCPEIPIVQPGRGSVSLQVGRAEFALGDGVHRWRDRGHPCLARACDFTSGLWSTGKLHSGAIWRDNTYRKWPRPRRNVIRCSHHLTGGLSVCRSFAGLSPAWLRTVMQIATNVPRGAISRAD